MAAGDKGLYQKRRCRFSTVLNSPTMAATPAPTPAAVMPAAEPLPPPSLAKPPPVLTSPPIFTPVPGSEVRQSPVEMFEKDGQQFYRF